MKTILILSLSLCFVFCKEKNSVHHKPFKASLEKDTAFFRNNEDVIVAVTLSEEELNKQNEDGLEESIADFRYYFNRAATKLKKCDINFYITASRYIKIGEKVIDKKEMKGDSFYILIAKSGKITFLKDSYTDLDLLNEFKKYYNTKNCQD